MTCLTGSCGGIQYVPTLRSSTTCMAPFLAAYTIAEPFAAAQQSFARLHLVGSPCLASRATVQQFLQKQQHLRDIAYYPQGTRLFLHGRKIRPSISTPQFRRMQVIAVQQPAPRCAWLQVLDHRFNVCVQCFQLVHRLVDRCSSLLSISMVTLPLSVALSLSLSRLLAPSFCDF